MTHAVLSRYRQHADQTLARADEATEAAARTRFLRWLSGCIDKRGVEDGELRLALEDAFGRLLAAVRAD